VAFGHLLDVTRARGEARRERLGAATPFVPTPVWVVLLLGGLVTIMFVALFADRREPAGIQAALIASVAVMVVAGLLLVRFLDHPYEGTSGSIEPKEMKRTISILDRTYPGERVCDPRGSPTVRSSASMPAAGSADARGQLDRATRPRGASARPPRLSRNIGRTALTADSPVIVLPLLHQSPADEPAPAPPFASAVTAASPTMPCAASRSSPRLRSMSADVA
jgi:hypothetical protein